MKDRPGEKSKPANIHYVPGRSLVWRPGKLVLFDNIKKAHKASTSCSHCSARPHMGTSGIQSQAQPQVFEATYILQNFLNFSQTFEVLVITVRASEAPALCLPDWFFELQEQ